MNKNRTVTQTRIGLHIPASLSALVLLMCVFPSVVVGKPNVIVLLTDDQGYGDFSCHGNSVLKTTNIDKLHSQSIRFTDFHVAPVCTPTRGQLLTGRDAMHNGAWSRDSGHEMIHAENKTMADIFKANGYVTGHFGKWHLGDNYPFRSGDKGFDESVTFGGAAVDQTPDYWQNDNLDDFYRHRDGVWRQHKGYCTDVWFNLSMEFMSRCQKENKPFFLYLPTNAPHTPTYVEPKYANLYKSRPAKFFGMIANLDENVGRLNAFLTNAGLAEDTILIFLTDNGGALGLRAHNAGLRGKKKSYYEGGHRAACFVRWPRGEFGTPRDIDDLTHVQDVLPTLIDLLDLETDKETRRRFDGLSLAGLLTGRQKGLPDRKLVVQWSELDYPNRGDAAVMWKKWRLVHDRELYNLLEDPSQKKDVAEKHPEIVKVTGSLRGVVENGTARRGHSFTCCDRGCGKPIPTNLFRVDEENWQGQANLVSHGLERRSGEWKLDADRCDSGEISVRASPPSERGRLRNERSIPKDKTGIGDLSGVQSTSRSTGAAQDRVMRQNGRCRPKRQARFV